MFDVEHFFQSLPVSSPQGCQIILTKELDGMTLTLPQATRNFYVDGHVPKPHWAGGTTAGLGWRLMCAQFTNIHISRIENEQYIYHVIAACVSFTHHLQSSGAGTYIFLLQVPSHHLCVQYWQNKFVVSRMQHWSDKTK